MTKLIRNLSFASFLAVASLSPSTGLQAQSSCSYIIETYCLWGFVEPENGEFKIQFACSEPIACSQMSWCCTETCEGEQLEPDFECSTHEGYKPGSCECW